MTPELREQAIHPEGNAIFGYDGGNHFVRNGKVRPKGVFCCERHGRLDRKLFAASENKSTLLQEVEKRHEQGVYITKKRCAELDGAARLRLNFCD